MLPKVQVNEPNLATLFVNENVKTNRYQRSIQIVEHYDEIRGQAATVARRILSSVHIAHIVQRTIQIVEHYNEIREQALSTLISIVEYEF